MTASIVTNCMWIQADPHGSLQEDENLMPGKWLGPENEENVHQTARKMRLNDSKDPAFTDLDLAHREQVALLLTPSH